MKTTRLTIETERVLVIHKSRAGSRGSCEACSDVVRLVTIEEAAALARISPRAIYRLIEAEKIHFSEPAEGFLLVCFASLSRSLLGAS